MGHAVRGKQENNKQQGGVIVRFIFNQLFSNKAQGMLVRPNDE